MLTTSNQDLRSLWRRMHNNASITEIRGFQPGSLGSVLDYDKTVNQEIYQIGSLSIKLCLYEHVKMSILIFKNGKIKISGGLGKLDCDDNMNDVEFDDFFAYRIIQPCMQVLCAGDPDCAIEYTIKKKIINACMRRNTPIGKPEYLIFLTKLKETFSAHQVILPQIMQANGKRRGRICAVKVENRNGNGSFAVDHGGTVQFFAYTNIAELKQHANQLIPIWR